MSMREILVAAALCFGISSFETRADCWACGYNDLTEEIGCFDIFEMGWPSGRTRCVVTGTGCSYPNSLECGWGRPQGKSFLQKLAMSDYPAGMTSAAVFGADAGPLLARADRLQFPVSLIEDVARDDPQLAATVMAIRSAANAGALMAEGSVAAPYRVSSSEVFEAIQAGRYRKLRRRDMTSDSYLFAKTADGMSVMRISMKYDGPATQQDLDLGRARVDFIQREDAGGMYLEATRIVRE